MSKIDRNNPYLNFIHHTDKNGVLITNGAYDLEKEWNNNKKDIWIDMGEYYVLYNSEAVSKEYSYK